MPKSKKGSKGYHTHHISLTSSKKPEMEDDPDHYRIKSVDPKFNIFNRKLMRKAKRKGVKDVEEYV